ncbi:MAG: phosphatase PAP2 family protein [Gaiellaceae bacterium]
MRDGEAPVPVIVLLVVSAVAGVAAWLCARAAFRRWWGRAPAAAVAEQVREHSAVGRFVHSRLDAEVLTGLALTLASAALVLAGIVVSLLAVLVRHSEALADLDSGAARWSHDHPGELTHRILVGVTSLASTQGVIVIVIVAGLIEWIRLPNRWLPVFLVLVTAGNSLLTYAVKDFIDRARPAIDPGAAALGPSFPSGHSSSAAALFAALALLAGRRRSAQVRAALIGVAAGLAVAVACSRVLLDLHWVSDVVAGLALGWGWFAACAIAFGGWLLRLGAPVEQAARLDERPASPAQRGPGSARS